MPTETIAAANVLRHDNHTAPASLTERTLTQPANFLLIKNSHATLSLSVSFDGVNTYTLGPGSSLSLETAKQKTYWTAEVTATATVEVLYGSEK